jgi:hypothetical protein
VYCASDGGIWPQTAFEEMTAALPPMRLQTRVTNPSFVRVAREN